MTKDDSHPTPRPGDPFTAQDGAALYTQIEKTFGKISGELQAIAARMASIEKSGIEMRESLLRIEAGLSDSRYGRLELELREAELERDIAERNLRAVEEKVNIKQEAKASAVDTNERIKAVASSAYTELEKKRKEASESFYLDLKRSIIKAVLISLSVGAVTGTLGFVFWLFQLYLNR